MPQPLSGQGLGLPFPTALYPLNIPGVTPFTAPTNAVSLGPASTVTIPAGPWIVSVTGAVSALQWLNPVTQQWTNLLGPGAAWATLVRSDGFSFRVNNLSTSFYGALITAAGTNYVQASTTVTPGTGNSTWQAVVGGALGAFTIVGTGGSGYTKPPLVFIPAPPPPGVAATATAALTAGSVSAITIRTAGAGYLSPPPVLLVTDPTDPSAAIVPAAATVALTGAGTITAILLVNAGQGLATAPTLAVGGVGTGATATTNPATVVAAANDVATIQPAVL